MWQTIKRVSLVSLTVMCFTALSGCISPSNEVIEGLGSPDPTQCSTIPDVEDGTLYQPRTEAVTLATDNRKHPDVFYMAWSKLDNRSDLRFPEKGYDDNGFALKTSYSSHGSSLTAQPATGSSYHNWIIRVMMLKKSACIVLMLHPMGVACTFLWQKRILMAQYGIKN